MIYVWNKKLTVHNHQNTNNLQNFNNGSYTMERLYVILCLFSIK